MGAGAKAWPETGGDEGTGGDGGARTVSGLLYVSQPREFTEVLGTTIGAAGCGWADGTIGAGSAPVCLGGNWTQLLMSRAAPSRAAFSCVC